MTSLVPVKLPILYAFYRREGRLADVVEIDASSARVTMEDALTGNRFPVMLAEFRKGWTYVWKPADEDPRA